MKLWIFSFFSWFSLGENLILSVGEKRILNLQTQRVIHIGQKDLVSLSSVDENLHLLGKKEGQTFLTIGSKTYKVFVLKEKTKQDLLLLDSIIQKTWGLHWTLSKDHVPQITGQLHRIYDWVEISKQAQRYNIHYEFKAQLGEDLQPTLEVFFKNYFKNKLVPDIQWTHLPFAFLPKEAPLAFYEAQLKAFGLKIQKDQDWFHSFPFINIEIALIETNSSSSLFFGNNHNSQDQLSSFKSLLNLLNLMKSSGKGKTLHHSSVLAQHGKEVHIHNGGEIPFSKYNSETKEHSTDWKSYGLDLRLTAFLDKKEQIVLKIQGDLSEPLSTPMEGKAPPMKNQRIKVNLQTQDQRIVKIYHQKKQGTGTFSKGGLDFSFSFLKSLVRNHRNYNNSQIILIQPKIIRKANYEHTSRYFRK
ncbi:MAG: hypothetical protein ACR2M7_04865 [Bdellovibrionales bacterium]